MTKTTRLSGENEIVRFLQTRYQGKSPFVKKGIGDDAAVLHPRNAQEYWVVTTDMLLENIDFRCEWTTPWQLGRKSLAVNLSDLAAMGARPRFITVCLALPAKTTESWVREFYAGLADLGRASQALLIGGDLSGSESGIQISITAIGESLRRKILYRSGGKPGDLLYVTGVLGRSAAGLKLLETGCVHPGSRRQKEALRCLHTPEPRYATGLWLAQTGLVRCMMDLSDGISADLPRLCAASKVGAEISLADLPVFAPSTEWGCEPRALALHGGEDFELLFAVPESKAARLEKIYPSAFPPVTKIGRLVPGAGQVWVLEPGNKRSPLPALGFDHFRP
jgi:thiamine-monophosphate kinase